MNLSDFAKRFRPDNIEIVIQDEKIVKMGDYADFFYSYCMFDGQLYSLNDRHPIISRYSGDSAEFSNSRILLNRYARTEQGFEIIEQKDLGIGWDPRVVSNGIDAYAIIISNVVVTGHFMLVYNLKNNRLLPVKMANPDLLYGKNWQPFIVDGELYVVHELVPFRILKINADSGHADIVREIDIDFRLPSFPSAYTLYPMFRGGCNALVDKSMIFGMGRATSQAYRHHPFFWSVDETDHIEFIFTDFFSAFHDRGYNIIDPTCLFIEDGSIYFGLVCSELDWAHAQFLSHFLFAIRPTNQKGSPTSLVKFFQTRSKTQEMGKPLLERHLFFCVEMPSSIDNVLEWGGRVSTGSAGHLVHGPYVEIEREDSYCTELSYLTKSGSAKRVGEFDVVVSRKDKFGVQGDIRVLGKIDLPATDGNLQTKRIRFKTTRLKGQFLEFRVYVDEGVELNASHIRTWRRDENAEGDGSPYP